MLSAFFGPFESILNLLLLVSPAITVAASNISPQIAQDVEVREFANVHFGQLISCEESKSQDELF